MQVPSPTHTVATFKVSLRLKLVIFITFPVAALFIVPQRYLTQIEIEEANRNTTEAMVQHAANMALRLELESSRKAMVSNASSGDSTTMANLFAAVDLQRQPGAQVIDADGNYLYQADTDQLTPSRSLLANPRYARADLEQLLALATGGESGLLRLQRQDIDDITWIAYAPVKSVDGYYLEMLSQQAVLEPVERLQRLSNLIETAATTALILLCWVLATLLAAPIRGLADAAINLAKGNLSTRAQPGSNDEMGDLITSFNTMAELVAQREEDLAKRVDRRTRELRESLDRAERINKSKGEILSVASHDLKNPLTAIAGLADVLSMMHRGELERDEQQELEMLQHINSAATHMTQMVGDIVQGERLELRGLEVSNFPVDLSELALSVIRLSERAAINKQIKLLADIRPGIDIKGDAPRLREALDNYVSNAIKYSPIGGEVVISLVPDEDDANATFAVQDNGEGLSTEDQAKLFGKFQKLTARPTAGESSSGLGLSIVKSIIELHSGNVGCESELGSGSRFWFTLPIWHN